MRVPRLSASETIVEITEPAPFVAWKWSVRYHEKYLWEKDVQR